MQVNQYFNDSTWSSISQYGVCIQWKQDASYQKVLVLACIPHLITLCWMYEEHNDKSRQYEPMRSLPDFSKCYTAFDIYKIEQWNCNV